MASLFTISLADEILVDEYEAEEAADFEQRRDIINRWQPIICMINILIALAICYCWMNSIADNMERGKDTKYDKESQSTMDCSSSCETCHARIRNSRSIPSTINTSRHHVSKADAVPIMPQFMNKEEDDTTADQMYLTRKFSRSTWAMYYRITSARKARAKCQICFGSMEENEEEAIVQACPSDLHREEGERESSLLLTNTHQECYYGAVTSEQTVCRVCPRKLLKSDDNMIFDLDL